MDERRDELQEEGSRSRGSRAMAIVAAVLLVLAGIGFAYAYHQQAAVSDLTSHETDMNSTITQLQNQIDSLTTKLNQVSSQPAPAAPGQPGTASAGSAKWRASENKRIKQLQSQLADEQQQLKDTQDSVAQTRTDLEGNINSTRDDLNGSIAKTHEELVALEQRGERNYFEFDLTRAKKFEHAGPIMISLRKADPKHKHYDLVMVVDDNQLTKKNVNLYEPVWIHTGDDTQPVQIVVNKIDKDHIHGYVSAPKYNISAQTTGATMQPVSTNPVSIGSGPTTAPDSNAAPDQGQTPGTDTNSPSANPQP